MSFSLSSVAKPGQSLRRLACAILLAVLGGTLQALSPAPASTAFAQTNPPETTQVQPAQPPIKSADDDAVSNEVRATLAQYGSFVQDQLYGEIWIPSVTPQGWRPYMACDWVNTRQYGWFYDDKSAWGQIIHHYGRWTRNDELGWFWVPGNQFSPGWVVWRTSPEWIGWAPMLPDEDIKRISADEFNNGGFWTFMKIANFDSGCTGGAVAPRTQIPVLLQETQFVTEFEFVDGIGIIVLPPFVVGEFVDIDIAFTPWPVWYYTQIVLDWTWVWNTIDVVMTYVYVDCTPPRPAPVVTLPPLPNPPPPPPPPPCANGEPRNGDGTCPIRVRPCPDGSMPDGNFHCPLPPPVYCPPGTHATPLGCVTNPRPCPDGSLPDQSGRCRLPAPLCPPGYYLTQRGCLPVPVPCPPGTLPGSVSGQCVPYIPGPCPAGTLCPPLPRCPAGQVMGPNGCGNGPVICPPGTILRQNECVPPRPACPPGQLLQQDGSCQSPVTITCPPGMVHGGITGGCIPAGGSPCPPGLMREPNGTCGPHGRPVCPPGTSAGPGGQCVIAGPSPCPPGQIPGPGGRCRPPYGPVNPGTGSGTLPLGPAKPPVYPLYPVNPARPPIYPVTPVQPPMRPPVLVPPTYRPPVTINPVQPGIVRPYTPGTGVHHPSFGPPPTGPVFHPLSPVRPQFVQPVRPAGAPPATLFRPGGGGMSFSAPPDGGRPQVQPIQPVHPLPNLTSPFTVH